MGWVPQVNGHIQIFFVSGTKIKVQPGIITAVVAGNTVNARVGHHGGTYVNLVRNLTTIGTPTYPCYMPM